MKNIVERIKAVLNGRIQNVPKSLEQAVQAMLNTRSQGEEIPFPVEMIKGDERREEFVADYVRLVRRCGHNAMSMTFIHYIEEQTIYIPLEEERKTNPKKQLPKMKLLGYNNTSKIVIRFVENGWADYYLLSKNPKGKHPYMVTWGKELLFIAQNDGGKAESNGVEILLIKPKKNIFDFALGYFNELKEESTLIPPNKIREVFAEIDRKYG